MSTIVTRAGKGSALTHNEVDANFTNLNTDKLQSGNTAAALTITSATIAGGTINGTTVGATTPASGSFTSLTDSGNLTFTGTGNRITGDFSNATVANRVMFQTSTVNGTTSIATLPNGTNATSSVLAFGGSDPANAPFTGFNNTATESQILASKIGTGTFLPMTFFTGGSERMRIDTSGNVGIGTSSPATALNVYRSGAASIEVDSDTSAFIKASIYSSNTSASGLQMAKYRGTLASPTAVNSADGVGQLNYLAYGGTNIRSIARIDGFVDTYTSDTNISGNLRFLTNGGSTAPTERMRIDSSGNVGIGTSSPGAKLDVRGSSTFLVNATNPTAWISVDSALTTGSMYNQWNTTSNVGISGTYTNHAYTFVTNNTERARIPSGGGLLVGKTSADNSTAGWRCQGDGYMSVVRSNDTNAVFNRLGNDGNLIDFQQDNTTEGSISVSGTTVSYNGGHLSRWAQMLGTKDESLVKGTVMSNLDAMNEYFDADGNPVPNEQLNKVKVSDVEGDANVAGVFVNWTHDEAHDVDEINMAMTGDMIIRIAQGVVVQRGDLLMSAGDGTAKPQGDDIVRSKTVAKVTSNHVTCTYDDGSYCVPCVLMAC